MTFQATVNDIKLAYEYATKAERLNGNWIYSVDPETMEVVKGLWNKSSGEYSLYNIFCKILKAYK